MRPLAQQTRSELAATYLHLIGYDPFEDSPDITEAEVRQTLREYLKECTQIHPEQNDEGRTVFAWSALSGGGYCATEADARSDAESYLMQSCES